MSLLAQSTIKYLTLQEAARRYPPIEGRHPHLSAVWRQARRGLLARSGKRIRLEHVRVGRRVMIPDGAVERFLDDLAREDAVYFDAASAAAKPAPSPTLSATPKLRAKQIAAAEALCAKKGI